MLYAQIGAMDAKLQQVKVTGGEKSTARSRVPRGARTEARSELAGVHAPVHRNRTKLAGEMGAEVAGRRGRSGAEAAETGAAAARVAAVVGDDGEAEEAASGEVRR